MSSAQNSRFRIKNNTQFWIQVVIIVFTFLIYSNTLSHDYALDDAMVVTHNSFTQQGVDGLKSIFTTDSFTGFYGDKKVNLPGGRYRPLSIATFAIEHQLWGDSPHFSHFINVLIYILTVLVLYWVLRMLFKKTEGTAGLFNLPLIATLIFMVHPIHTEVVANIKGRDELLSLFFSLLSLLSAIKYVNRNRWQWLVASFGSAFLGLLSKENAITFVAIIPLSIYFFREVSVSKIVKASIPMALAAVLFLIIRSSVVGGLTTGSAPNDLMNNPFLEASFGQKYATILFTLGNYLKLLFLPYPLTFDYYPYHISLVGWGNFLVILSVLIYLGLLVYAIKNLPKKSVLAFAILVYLGALFPVSNLVVNIGVFMNERFVYQASVGFVIGVSWLVVWVSEKYSSHKFKFVKEGALVAVLLTFSVLTFSRNFAWKDSSTLFLTDVKTSANSAKSNLAAGGALIDLALNGTDSSKVKEELTLAKHYLTRATEIDPGFSDAWRKLGIVQYELNGDMAAAFNCYFTAIKLNRADEDAYSYIYLALSKYGDSNRKIEMYNQLLKLNPRRSEVYSKQGMVYGRDLRDYPSAISCFEKAIQLDPKNNEALKGMGIVHLLLGSYDESLRWLEKAVVVDPLEAGTHQLMGNVYQKMGNTEKAAACLQKAKELTK